MSERGSFVTEYIYCDKCYEAAREVFVSDDKYLRGVPIPMWGEGNRTGEGFGDDKHPRELPIIAGKIGGLYAGEEIHEMGELLRELKPKLCDGHTVSVAVLSDSGRRAIMDTDHEDPIVETPSWLEVQRFKEGK